MPTTFGTGNANVIIGGQTVFSAGFGGRDALYLETDAVIDVSVTGAELVISVFSFASTITVTVDGSTTTPSVSTGAWTTMTVFTGLSDTLHTVRIRASSTFFDVNGAFIVDGASPALSVTSGLAATQWKASANTSYFRTDGTLTLQGTGSYLGLFDSSLRFKATCSSIRIFTLGAGQKLRTYVDGVDAGLVTIGSTSVWDWHTIASGLDSGAEHEYRVFLTNDVGWYTYNVMTLGGSANVVTTLPAYDTWAFYGDSIVTGIILTGDSTEGFANIIGRAMLKGVRNLGIANTKVVGSNPNGEGRTADVTGKTPDPTAVFILYGVNDAKDGGTWNAATFEASYENMLTSIVAGIPADTPIYCLMFLESNATWEPATTNRAAAKTAIQNAVAAIGDPAVQFFDTDGWIDPNDTGDLGDGLHPETAGFIKIANEILAFFSVGGVLRRRSSMRTLLRR